MRSQIFELFINGFSFTVSVFMLLDLKFKLCKRTKYKKKCGVYITINVFRILIKKKKINK